MFDFSVFLKDFNMLETVGIELPDNRNNVLGAHIPLLPRLGMGKKNRAIERLIFVSAMRVKFFEAINLIISEDVYQASKTTEEKGMFLATASAMNSLARSGLLLKSCGGRP